jgi:hypothetical protein
VWASLIFARFVRRRTTFAPVSKALLLTSALFVLVSCDPGYSMQIHNGCDAQLKMDLLTDASQLPGSGVDIRRVPDVVPAHSDISYSVLDDDGSAVGVFLMSGPRSGDVVRSIDNEVVIPHDACPSS